MFNNKRIDQLERRVDLLRDALDRHLRPKNSGPGLARWEDDHNDIWKSMREMKMDVRCDQSAIEVENKAIKQELSRVRALLNEVIDYVYSDNHPIHPVLDDPGE